MSRSSRTASHPNKLPWQCASSNNLNPTQSQAVQHDISKTAGKNCRAPIVPFPRSMSEERLLEANQYSFVDFSLPHLGPSEIYHWVMGLWVLGWRCSEPFVSAILLLFDFVLFLSGDLPIRIRIFGCEAIGGGSVALEFWYPNLGSWRNFCQFSV